MKSGFKEVFQTKNFLLLWYGQIISSIGDRFYLFALLGVVLGIEHGSGVGKDTARFTFCGMLPGLLLAPLYGWIVDHCNRQWVMIWADLIRVGLTLSLLYIWFVCHSLWGVYAVVFWMGAFNGLFIPARQAALPQIVPPEVLVSANALISLIGVIANLVGVLFASLVVSIFGAWSSFLLNALGFVASAGLIYRIQANLTPGPQISKGQGFWHECLSGLHVLEEQRELWPIVLVNTVFAFIGSAGLITILQQTVVKMDLHSVHHVANFLTLILTPFAPKPPAFEIRTLSFGLLFAGIGVGLGFGVGFCGWAQRWSRSKALPFIALGLLGGALILFSRLQSFTPAFFGAALLGFVSSLIVIPIEARLQNDVDDGRRGRLFAFRNLCTTLGSLIGLAINIDGRLLDRLGPSQLIIYEGSFAIASALLLALTNARNLTAFWTIRIQPRLT